MEQRAGACRLVFDEDGFVFTSEADGSHPLHPDTITGGFRRLCYKIGLKGVRLHEAISNGETFTQTEVLLFGFINGKVAEIQDFFAEISLNDPLFS